MRRIGYGAVGVRAACLGALLAALAVPQAAWAQEEADASSVTARERQRAEDTSIHVGAFLVSPQLSVDATYDDNIYATNTNADGDLYFTFRPEVFIRSNWSSNSLSAHAFFEQTVYSRFSTENNANFGIDVASRLDVSRQTRFFVNISAVRQREQRSSLSSFFNTLTPVRYDTYTVGFAAEQDLGNLDLRAEGSVKRRAYGDARLATGIIDQEFRNSLIYAGALQASYDINGITKVIARGSYEARRLDLRPGDVGFDPITQTDRSGDGVRVELGVEREITRLVDATVRVGYLSFRYPDPRLRDISAFSYYANLRWNVTPLTTINASAERRVDETTSQITAGNLRDEVSATADHELLRNLILSLSGRLAWINPSVLQGAGLLNTRSSREQEIAIQARYYLNRRMRLQGGYTYSARQSSDQFIAFSSNRFELSLNYAF